MQKTMREFNTKCILISGGAVVAYWALPPRRVSVAVGLAIATYVAIAWYDLVYNCDTKLRALGGLFGAITAPFKPAVVDGRYGGGMAAAPALCGGGAGR